MKGSLIITFLFFVVSPVLGELTKEDLQAIEAIIEKSEARTKEYIDSKYNQVTTKIEEMDKRLTSRIEGVDKRLTDQRNILIALIGFIAAVIIGQPWILNKLQKNSNKPTLSEDQKTKYMSTDPNKLHADSSTG